MKKYIFFGNAGCDNHGCEAIIRSTKKMLGDGVFYLQSEDWASDQKFGIDAFAKPVFSDSTEIKRSSPKGLLLRAKARLQTGHNYDELCELERHRGLIKKGAVAMSIGGDNYCYKGIIYNLRSKLNAFCAAKIPTLLWGCSLDKAYFDPETVKDLKKYQYITVRESLSLQNLYDIGIKDNVIECSDPAFTLESQPTDVKKEFFADGEVIGLNVSDFMKYYNAYPEATLKNFMRLIEYILRETAYKILLIPHVRQANNNDLLPSLDLKNTFDTDRIAVLEEDLNCMQLKYLISKCTLFIGCRTHSTIAAYSTGVPTLVVGYSIKAKGICTDIFGSTDHLIVDVRNFEDDNDLTKCFAGFLERSGDLREQLHKTMPGYIQKAYNALSAIEKCQNLL